jgi:hypothetical protein
MEIVSEEEPEDLDIDMNGINLNRSRVEEDESTAGEKYSKPVGDRTFQKFVRRVEQAPEQILRYSPAYQLIDVDIFDSMVRLQRSCIVRRMGYYHQRSTPSAVNARRRPMSNSKLCLDCSRRWIQMSVARRN